MTPQWWMPIAWFVGALMAHGQELAPFYLIENSPSGILLHFDTAAFRGYQLQSTTNLVVRPPAQVPWVTIHTVPPVPFANHYIILDSRTNAPAKCYRILVTQ